MSNTNLLSASELREVVIAGRVWFMDSQRLLTPDKAANQAAFGDDSAENENYGRI